MRHRFKTFGPFSYFQVKELNKNFISAWLTKNPHSDNCGWEWGSDNLSDYVPFFHVEMFGLTLLKYEKFTSGYIIHFLGFWWMKS